MSNNINDSLLERADMVRSYFEGTDLETAIGNQIERQDLEMLAYLVAQGEAEMSRQEFYNYNIIDGRDEAKMKMPVIQITTEYKGIVLFGVLVWVPTATNASFEDFQNA